MAGRSCGSGNIISQSHTLFDLLALVGLLTVITLIGVVVAAALERPQPQAPRFVKRREGRPELTVHDLAVRLGVDAEYLRRFGPRYRHARVPKRAGGWRTLRVPDAPTKALQRRLLRRVLNRLTAHPAALGFERGRSIVDHAAVHAGSAVLVKCDVADFFSSTSSRRVGAFYRRIGWDDEAAAILVRLTCHDNGLPQGAPTSPRLSNLVNRGLDDLLTTLATRRGMRYSRYADDLCFSYAKERRTTARRVRGMLQEARRTLAGYGYRLRPGKTHVLRPHQRQQVCGLVVNDRPNLPRGLRRKLRAAEHRRRVGAAATWTDAQLKGWAAYRAMVGRGR